MRLGILIWIILQFAFAAEGAPPDSARQDNGLNSPGRAVKPGKSPHSQRIADAKLALKGAGSENAQEAKNALITLAKSYISLKQFDSSTIYINRLKEISEEGKDYQALGQALLIEGWLMHFRNMSLEAYESFNSALEMFLKAKDNSGAAEAIHNISFLHGLMGEYDLSMESLIKSLSISESEGDDRLMSFNYSNLGAIYERMGNLEDALYNYNLSLQSAKKADLPERIAAAYLDLGQVYLLMGIDSIAMNYFRQALKINESFGISGAISDCHNNIGAVYHKLGDFEKAIKCYEKSISIKEEPNLELASRLGSKSTLANLGRAYLEAGELDKAEKVVQKSLILASQDNLREIISEDYLILSEIYAAKGAYEKANEFLKKRIKLEDSLFTEENNQNIARMKALYDIEKKDFENQLLREQGEKDKEIIKNQDRLNSAIIVALILFGALAFVLLWSNIHRKRNNRALRSQKKEIELKNAELQKKNLEIEERNDEIQRAYSDIKILSAIGQDIISNLKAEAIIELVYEKISSLMRSSVFAIGLYNPAKNRLDFAGAYEKGNSLPFFYNELTDKNRLAVWCFLNQQEVLIHDYLKDSVKYIPNIPEPKAGENTESLIYLPLTLKNKRIGVVTVQSFKKGVYSDYNVQMLRNIATYTAIALENAESYEKIESQNTAIEEYNIELEQQKEEIQAQSENLQEANVTILEKNKELTELNKSLDKYINMIDSQLYQAADYVISLIPGPVITEHYRVSWRFMPSAQLGGDAFGYYDMDKETTVFFLLDVCGHGIGPALHSISVFNTIKFRALPETDFKDPESVLNSLNSSFQMTEHNGLYFTLWYGVYNKKDKELTYAGAGHPPAFLFNGREGGIDLPSTNAFVGGFPKYDFSKKTAKISSDSTLYVFSDGAYEVNKKNGGFWTLEELKDFLSSPSSHDGAELDSLYHNLKSIAKNDKLNDDFSIMKINFK